MPSSRAPVKGSAGLTIAILALLLGLIGWSLNTVHSALHSPERLQVRDLFVPRVLVSIAMWNRTCYTGLFRDAFTRCHSCPTHHHFDTLTVRKLFTTNVLRTASHREAVENSQFPLFTGTPSFRKFILEKPVRTISHRLIYALPFFFLNLFSKGLLSLFLCKAPIPKEKNDTITIVGFGCRRGRPTT